MTAEYFDEWHANNNTFRTRDELQREFLGAPAGMVMDNLLPWDAIGEIVAALRLRPGERLLDLACGRGSVGLEIARHAGAALTGVDFSREAVRHAEAHAHALGQDASYRVADMTSTGLAAGWADAVVCVDAIQFGGHDAFVELSRVLAPGGRVALTGWQPLDYDDERVSRRLRSVRFGAELTAAGFDAVEVAERSDWRRQERAMWEAAAALDPGDDPALRSMHDEGLRSLETFPLVRRVLATAVRPAA